MQAFRFDLSFSCKLILRFIWPICLRFYVLFSLFGDTIQLFDSYRILKEKEELLPVLLYHVHDCLLNLSEAGNSFQGSHRKEMSEFNSLIQVVSCAEILCWSLLERINYFSFDLCVCVQNL